MKEQTPLELIVVCLLIAGVTTVGLQMNLSHHKKRIERLEHIVGFETPASTTWTNGHTYMTVVKHSANCPCVKK